MLAPVGLCLTVAAGLVVRQSAAVAPACDTTVEAACAPPMRVYLDAGHGAEGNSGNEDAWCRDEQDVMMDVATEVGAALDQSERFEVRLSRQVGQRVEYRDRLAAATAFDADVLLSLHSDARGMAMQVDRGGTGRSCPENASEPGFAVLWSDEGDQANQRLALARALATALSDAGFLAYDGVDYGTIYEGDALVDGVFLDRHIPRQRIMMLRRPTMPSVIVETHHAWHPVEAAAWQEADVRARFAAALDVGLQAWAAAP